MTAAEKGRIYTYRLRGCGRALTWDDERGAGPGCGTPVAMAAMTGFSPAAALFFGKLNNWRYLGREVEADGDIIDWYTKLDGTAIVLHTQSGQTPRYTPGLVIDRLPEPWVGAVPGDPPFIGYVVQFPPHRES